MNCFGSMRIAALALILSVLVAPSVSAQVIGITNGFSFTANPQDTVPGYLSSLPNWQTGEAGEHGFIRNNESGSFVFDDGTPARFFGVTIQWNACFPDSIDAIVTAARLRKLGVNLARFEYMENSYDWGQTASILDIENGARTLHPEQTKRFDWFVYQLKKHGIYTQLVLQSARTPTRADGYPGVVADSLLWLGYGSHHLYPQGFAAHKLVAALLLNHVNPYTGSAYKSEPAIASLQITSDGGLLSLLRLNYLNYNPDAYTISWNASRRLDTMFAQFLKNTYGSTDGVRQAWAVVPPEGGFTDAIADGSFEGDFDQTWEINSYNGPTVSKILTQDSVPDGDLALTLRVRNSISNLYTVYMRQFVALEYNKLYRLSFNAKCSNPDGRRIEFYSNIVDQGLSAGLSGGVDITPYWQEHESYFLVPVQSSAPAVLTIYLGDKDGDVTIDNIQLREFATVGLQPNEDIEEATVTRIDWGNPVYPIVSPRRTEDQSEFYMALERDYLANVFRYVVDTIGVQQPVAGADMYWASTVMDAVVAKAMDFTTVRTAWDWMSNSGTNGWEIRNYSPLRVTWGTGAMYSAMLFVHEKQPAILTFSQPFPNRYQAESMLFMPSYAALQGIDGFLWSYWDNERGNNRDDYIDSSDYYSLRNNPALSSVFPIMSHAFRNGYIAPAKNTVRLQHNAAQIREIPRMGQAWGDYGVPGGIPGFAAAINKIAIDSLDASEFTQLNDLAFDEQVEGEIRSDTREILWEYLRGAQRVETDRFIAVSGVLNRPGGFSFKPLDVDVLSLNETATILWSAIDTASSLNFPGSSSILTMVSRAEPTGWKWGDSTYGSVWGTGPMQMEPIRARLKFKLPSNQVGGIAVEALDPEGRATGEYLEVTQSGTNYTVTIDQAQTKAVWYRVEILQAGTDAPGSLQGTGAIALTVRNSVSGERYAIVSLPETRSDVHLQLVDAQGRSVSVLRAGAMEEGITTVPLQLQGLPSGAYFLVMRTERGETITEPLIKYH